MTHLKVTALTVTVLMPHSSTFTGQRRWTTPVRSAKTQPHDHNKTHTPWLEELVLNVRKAAERGTRRSRSQSWLVQGWVQN